MRGRVWWWRWRRNELRRRSDVVEAWAVLAVAVSLLLGVPAAGLLAGGAAHADARATAAAQRAERHPVPAVTTEEAPPPTTVSAHESGGRKYYVGVRWRDADGTPRTGTARVAAGTPRGEHTRIWLDARGDVVSAPLTGTDVWAQALAAAAVAAGAYAVLVCGAHGAVRRLAQRRLMAEWDRAWARTGPEWGHRTT